MLRLLTNLRGYAQSRGRRLVKRMSGGTVLDLDYPPSTVTEPRFGYGRQSHAELTALLSRHDDVYRRQLDAFAPFESNLLAIPRTSDDPTEAQWDNFWFPHLDPISLYGLLRTRRPFRYVEIGSGNSTMFAARARRDGGLATTITSIDPAPRASIDALCDRVIRQPLERTDLAVFAELARGDIVFLDGSHRVFMNSDATIFFLEVLPRLPTGVVVGLHDIFLPDDYPPEWGQCYYSEQYLLAACLLFGAGSVQPILPCAYLSARPELSPVLERFLQNRHFARPDFPWLQRVPAGVSFWLETSPA